MGDNKQISKDQKISRTNQVHQQNKLDEHAADVLTLSFLGNPDMLKFHQIRHEISPFQESRPTQIPSNRVRQRRRRRKLFKSKVVISCKVDRNTETVTLSLFLFPDWDFSNAGNFPYNIFDS